MRSRKSFKYIILFVVFCAAVYLVSFTPANSLVDYYSLIFTFQSIIIGFIVTSLSIIVSSPFSKRLYSIQSEKNNAKTLLDEFLHSIVVSLIIFIIPLIQILLLLLLKYFPIPIKFFKLYDSSIFCLTIISLIYFIILILKIKSFVVQSAKVKE